MQTTLTFPADGKTRHQARRGLLIYFAVLVPLSALIQAAIISADLDGGANGLLAWIVLINALMLVPTIASVIARLTLREGFADVAFGIGGRAGRNAIGLAIVFPIMIGLVAYGLGWTTGVVGFEPRPVAEWLAALIIVLMLNLLVSSGEEIGWRGYMLMRLIDAGVPQPIIVSSLIWGAWHIPLVLWAGFANGPSPIFSAAVLMVTTLALGYVLARMRLVTGSVWPAIALHVAWNTLIQAGFDPLVVGTQKTLWIGETRVVTALTLLVAVAIYSRRRWTIKGDRAVFNAYHSA
jgi:membrane protease YdiL (CAAX protease family)